MEILANPKLEKAVFISLVAFAAIVSVLGYFVFDTLWILWLSLIGIPLVYIVLRFTLLRLRAIELNEKRGFLILKYRNQAQNRHIAIRDARMEIIIRINGNDQEREHFHIFEKDKRVAAVIPGLSGFTPDDLKGLHARLREV